MAATATRRDEEPHEHSQGAHKHELPRRRQLPARGDYVGADGLRVEMIPAPTSSRLDKRCRQRSIVGERPLRGTAMLSHPAIELRDKGHGRNDDRRSRNSASTQMLQDVPCSSSNDRTAPAASNSAAAPTPTACEVPVKRVQQLVIDGPNRNTPTSKPHAEVNDRTNKLPDRQRPVSRGSQVLDEVVEVRTYRLASKSNAGLVQKERSQTGAVMQSRRRHLDAASNDKHDKIIPSAA